MAGASTNDHEFVIGHQFGGIVRPSLEATEIDVTDGETIYFRWSTRTTREFIMRKKLTGTVWQTGTARGLWSGRAGLTYTPIEMGG